MKNRNARKTLLALTVGSSSLFALNAIAAGLSVSLTLGGNGTPSFTPVPDNALQGRQAGIAVAPVLPAELAQTVVAQGATPIENPALLEDGTTRYAYYGYLSDGRSVPAPGAVQSPGNNVEATKTEPDKNTYLVFPNGLKGADAAYSYGTHFLFQGHESGRNGLDGSKQGGITRINLDADGAHRVTLMAIRDTAGKHLPVFDGSTWYPQAQKLLLTAELGNQGGVWQATADYPSQVVDLSGALGRGGYEGIQADRDGNLFIVEDSGGPSGAVNTRAKQPNSFVYLFVPKDSKDLTQGGVLKALQILSLQNNQPIVFHAGQADADILSADQKDLYTYGKTFKARWVSLHDTRTDGFAPFDANALAKSKGATPMKRPENGVFRPGTEFTEFYFTATGDTNAQTEAGSLYGGFGGLFRFARQRGNVTDGTLNLFYRADVSHTGLDNLSFVSANGLLVGEDAGDSLHGQRNAFDSVFLYDVKTDYANGSQPPRLLYMGRDAAATVDASYSGGGFQNDGDNESTGIHVSDGNIGLTGLLGYLPPKPFIAGWRVFYTRQHGDNETYEILPVKTNP